MQEFGIDFPKEKGGSVCGYAGVLARASRWRSMIVPTAGESAADTEDVTDVSIWLPDPAGNHWFAAKRIVPG